MIRLFSIYLSFLFENITDFTTDSCMSPHIIYAFVFTSFFICVSDERRRYQGLFKSCLKRGIISKSVGYEFHPWLWDFVKVHWNPFFLLSPVENYLHYEDLRLHYEEGN